MLWRSVMARPPSSGIWKVKVDARLEQWFTMLVLWRQMPEKMSRRETADVLECGAPTEPQEVKKFVSPGH